MKEFVEEYGSLILGVISTLLIVGVLSGLYFSGTLGNMIIGLLGRAV